MMVYCKNCNWIELINGNIAFGGCPPCLCNHPDNLTSTSENAWYHKIVQKTYKKNPKDINQNNDCRWFEEIKQPSGCVFGTMRDLNTEASVMGPVIHI